MFVFIHKFCWIKIVKQALFAKALLSRNEDTTYIEHNNDKTAFIQSFYLSVKYKTSYGKIWLFTKQLVGLFNDTLSMYMYTFQYVVTNTK